MKKQISKIWSVLLGLCCIAAGSQAGCAAEEAAQTTAPDGMRLFLLIGQSNMAGRGKVEEQDLQTHPRIWMLNKEMQWAPAKDPLHWDKPTVAGVGLGSEFARTLAKADPNVNIGLIPAAFGGTSLDQWKPGGELYKNAVARAREAMKKGTLAGILWHQGESDSSPDKIASYPTRFAAMMAQLRKDLNAPEVPLVIGELGRFRPASEPFNAMLPGLVPQVPHTALVTAEDLADKGDKLHFGSPALRTLGQRYAAAWLKLRAQIKPS